MAKDLEEGSRLELDFGKVTSVAASGALVIPAVAQDIDSGRVLIVGYVNQQALKEAMNRKLAVFWSTSRNQLWIKGDTSGDFLELVEARVNCEQNSILYLVRPQGTGACHTRDASGNPRASCFYRAILDGKLEPVSDPVWSPAND